jgi:hypothetical protein
MHLQLVRKPPFGRLGEFMHRLDGSSLCNVENGATISASATPGGAIETETLIRKDDCVRALADNPSWIGSIACEMGENFSIFRILQAHPQDPAKAEFSASFSRGLQPSIVTCDLNTDSEKRIVRRNPSDIPRARRI